MIFISVSKKNTSSSSLYDSLYQDMINTKKVTHLEHTRMSSSVCHHAERNVLV